tara:strand:- start:194 stop:3979 length:3786 start_codon:yes stop_codon:yes gene_type:complete
MTQANKKVELYYRIGDNPNFSGTDQWLRAETQDNTNAITYFEYEHSLHKPAEARVTLINSVPNFRAADIDSKSGKLSILAAGDDAATNSDLFTDFMRVQLIDAHSKLVYLSGRIYDVEAEYNRLEGHTVKLIIKDDLEILRGVYVNEVGDTAYTGSTKRSVLIKDELIGDDNFDTPSGLALPFDFSDTAKFEASSNNFNGSGTLKYNTSTSSILQEISHLAIQDPSTAASDTVVTNSGFDFYVDANVGRTTGTDVDNAGADTRTPSNAHFNYFKRGTRPAGSNSVATYGLTVEFPTAAFTKTGQKLPMTENFDFDRPKHETFTDATITGIITGGKPATKNFEILDVTSISDAFTWTNLAFSDTDVSVATGSLTDVVGQTAGTDFAETLNKLNADGSGTPVAVARIQYQNAVTGSGKIMISDINSNFPTGTTQVMLKGASSNTTCLFTPSTGRLREKVGVKRTYKTQYGTYERFDDFRTLVFNILNKSGRSNIVRGSFSISQFPCTFVDYVPSGASDTVTAALSSGDPRNYGMRTGMPIGILNSSETFIEYYNYASAVGSSSIAVASVPQDKSGNTTKNFGTGSIKARFYVPVRAGDMIHVENPIEAIDGDFLVTKIVYTEGIGAMNARLEVVGKDDALGGKGPKITFTPLSQDFNTDAEHIQERNKNFSFPVDGSSVVKFFPNDDGTNHYRSIEWTAGPLKIGETTYSISAANTGNMVAYHASNPHNTTYKLYFDPRVSTTAIQVVRADGWENVAVGPTVTELGNARSASDGAGNFVTDSLAECLIINNPDGTILGSSKVLTGAQFQTKAASNGTIGATTSSSEGRIVIKDDQIIIHDGDSSNRHLRFFIGGTEAAFLGLDDTYGGLGLINFTALEDIDNVTIWSQNGAVTLRGSEGVDVVTGHINIKDTDTDTDDPAIRFSNQSDASLRWSIGVDGSDSDNLKFDYENTVGAATKMFLDATGNIYIGPSGSFAGAYTFNNDQNTFIHNPSADRLDIVTGGTTNAIFEANNIYVGPGGGFGGVYTFSNDTNTSISNPSADRLDLNTGGALAAVFENGDMYLGPASTGNFYTFSGDTDTAIVNPSSDLLRIVVGGDTLAEFREAGGAFFTGINQAFNASYGLIVAGTAAKTSAGTVWISTSDDRLKQDIASITNATDILKTLNPVEYNWKDEWKDAVSSIPNHKVHGFLASEYEDTFSDFVDTTDMKLIKKTDNSYRQSNEVEEDETIIYDNIKFINTDSLVPYLVAAIKELETRISSLEGE